MVADGAMPGRTPRQADAAALRGLFECACLPLFPCPYACACKSNSATRMGIGMPRNCRQTRHQTHHGLQHTRSGMAALRTNGIACRHAKRDLLLCVRR